MACLHNEWANRYLERVEAERKRKSIEASKKAPTEMSKKARAEHAVERATEETLELAREVLRPKPKTKIKN